MLYKKREKIKIKVLSLETLRLRFFGISRELRASRSHVTRPCRQVCGLRLNLKRLDHAPEVSDLPQGFFTLKPHNPTIKKKNHLLELFCLLIIEFYFKKRNFEDNFSAKIEVDELKQTWPPHGYHPRSPKYERTCNVKPLTVIMRYCALRPDPEV